VGQPSRGPYTLTDVARQRYPIPSPWFLARGVRHSQQKHKTLLKKLGFAEQDFTFHSLRHTFATELFRRGKHPKIVQSLLGHSSITQTMDRYSHLLENIGGDAVEELDESFG
jgi:integrase